MWKKNERNKTKEMLNKISLKSKDANEKTKTQLTMNCNSIQKMKWNLAVF